RCITSVLKIAARLEANVRDLDCNLIEISQNGNFAVVNEHDKKEFAFLANENPRSKIVVKQLKNHGQFVSTDETIYIIEDLTLAAHSVTSLENTALLLAKINFNKDCKFKSK